MEPTDKKKLKHKLKKPYRIVILKEDSFEEVGSFRLTPLSLYVLFSSLFIILSIFVALVIIFTPMKRWIPGYAEMAGNAEIIRLEKKLGTIEQQYELQKRYTDNIKRILTGDVTSTEEEPLVSLDSIKIAERIEEDELLRQQFYLNKPLISRERTGEGDYNKAIPLEKISFTVPVKGQVSAGFDIDKQHLGTDILAPLNTPIMTVLDGFVLMADWTLETGNSICILHDHQITTCYKHNSMLLKKPGDYVKAGEAIAIIGNTGTKTSGPHLHFELWHKGKAVDATRFISF
jgi:murein DD-endopeptidase MepM/ murein hydrolase activator NlpD